MPLSLSLSLFLSLSILGCSSHRQFTSRISCYVDGWSLIAVCERTFRFSLAGDGCERAWMSTSCARRRTARGKGHARAGLDGDISAGSIQSHFLGVNRRARCHDSHNHTICTCRRPPTPKPTGFFDNARRTSSDVDSRSRRTFMSHQVRGTS